MASVEVGGRRVADLMDVDCLAWDEEAGRRVARAEAERLLVRARLTELRPAPVDAGTSQGRGEQPDGGARGGGEQAGAGGTWAEPGRWGYDEFVGEEVALRARLSPSEGGKQTAFAVRVVRRLPAGVKALWDGRIDLARLVALDRLTAPLDGSLVAQVAGPVLAKGGRPSLKAFEQAVRRRVLVVDPDGAARRQKAAEGTRRVEARTEPDGMGRLAMFLPALRMLAVWARIDRLARQAGTGDARSLDQRRADVAYALLMGESLGRVNLEMQVVVPVETLLGLAERPGEIPGYGPVPAEIVREMSQDPRCTWRQMLTRRETGELVGLGRRRFPPAALARHVRARNSQCVLPGCNTPAGSSDLDHTVAWVDGGLTENGNLAPLCRRHHRMLGRYKQRPDQVSEHGARQRWLVEQGQPGHMTWTTPTGGEYHTHPDNYTET